MQKLNARVHQFAKPVQQSGYRVEVVQEEIFGSLPQEDRRKIDAYWEVVKQQYPNLFRKPILLNLEAFDIDSSGIKETANITDYALFVSKRNPDIPPYSAGLSEYATRRIRPRGASTVTITSDGYALFGRRPANVVAPNQVTIVPEGMLVTSMPNPFGLTLNRLEKEAGITRDAVTSLQMLGIGEEKFHCDIVSTMVAELSQNRAQVEVTLQDQQGLGVPKELMFKDTLLSTLADYLYGTNPGSANIAVLAFVNYYHGQVAYEDVIDKMGGSESTYGTLEAFCRPLGVPVRELKRD